MIASQVQLYLQVCGNTTLEQIKSKANITTVANIFALTGSVLDLMLYATDKKLVMLLYNVGHYLRQI